MFAELPDPTSFSAIGWSVVIIAGLAHGMNQIFKFITYLRETFREKPSTAELQDKQSEFATTDTVLRVESELKQEIGAVDRKVDAFKDQVVKNGEVRRQAIEGKVEALRVEMRKETLALSEKIGGVSEQVAEMRGTVNMTNQNIANLTSQIQRSNDSRS